MTVRDLMEKLRELPQDSVVVTEAYSGDEANDDEGYCLVEATGVTHAPAEEMDVRRLVKRGHSEGREDISAETPVVWLTHEE